MYEQGSPSKSLPFLNEGIFRNSKVVEFAKIADATQNQPLIEASITDLLEAGTSEECCQVMRAASNMYFSLCLERLYLAFQGIEEDDEDYLPDSSDGEEHDDMET